MLMSELCLKCGLIWKMQANTVMHIQLPANVVWLLPQIALPQLAQDAEQIPLVLATVTTIG